MNGNEKKVFEVMHWYTEYLMYAWEWHQRVLIQHVLNQHKITQFAHSPSYLSENDRHPTHPLFIRVVHRPPQEDKTFTVSNLMSLKH